MNTGTALRTFGLILAFVAMPFLFSVTGCATGNHHNQSVGERDQDQGTSARVMMALAEDTLYKYIAVSVATHNGKVQLSGSVNSGDQKIRAGDLAQKVPGVRNVVNNIKVKESVS